MKFLEEAIAAVGILLWIPGLIIGWIGYRKLRQQISWRTRVSRIVLITLSLTPVLILAGMVAAPNLDLPNGKGWEKLPAWKSLWTRTVMWPVIAAFIGSFFARPRLILPLSITALSFAFIWAMILAMP